MASNASFGGKTNGSEVAKAYSAQITGKTVLITGVSSGGIGEATARAFALGGASLIIGTSRSKARVDEVAQQVSSEYPSTEFRGYALDLGSFESVRHFANQILEDNSINEIDIVVANAAYTMHGGRREVTVDGIEKNFGVNHLGHFLLLKLLLPKVLAAAKKNPPGITRVVCVSSVTNVFSPVRFSDYNFDNDKDLPEDEKPDFQAIQAYGFPTTKGYSDGVAYAQSKTANVLFAVHINHLFKKEGIFAFAVHPGGVQSTAGKKFISEASAEQRRILEQALNKNIDQGSATTLVAASDPALDPANGLWLVDCQISKPVEWAVDEEKAARLWELSEDIIAKKLSV